VAILSRGAASRDDVQVNFVAQFVFVSAFQQKKRKDGKVVSIFNLMIRSSYHPPVSRKCVPIMKPTRNLKET
jgi:hypothetical protein